MCCSCLVYTTRFCHIKRVMSWRVRRFSFSPSPFGYALLVTDGVIQQAFEQKLIVAILAVAQLQRVRFKIKWVGKVASRSIFFTSDWSETVSYEFLASNSYSDIFLLVWKSYWLVLFSYYWSNQSTEWKYHVW